MPLSREPNPILARLLMRRGAVRTGPLAMIRKRHLDGMLVTMLGSGSHYLQWMLCMAMREGLGLPHPESLNDPVLIGRMHDLPPKREGVPRVIRTHTEMPVALFRALRRVCRFPRYIVLVRDLRESIVSYYEKTPPERRVAPFPEYLRGRDIFPSDHVFFRQVRFLNSWSTMRRLDPQRVLVMRYTDMRARPAEELARAWRCLGFPEVESEVFERAVALSTKDRMAQFASEEERSVVRTDKRHAFHWYDDGDRAYFRAVVDRWLRDDFGYDYHDWTIPEASGGRTAAAAV